MAVVVEEVLTPSPSTLWRIHHPREHHRLELLEESTRVHPVFHVSYLCRCLKLPDEQVPTKALDIQDALEYRDHPIQIPDRADKETRSTTIPMCKARWSNHTEREATWEKVSELRMLYPNLFERSVRL